MPVLIMPTAPFASGNRPRLQHREVRARIFWILFSRKSSSSTWKHLPCSVLMICLVCPIKNWKLTNCSWCNCKRTPKNCCKQNLQLQRNKYVSNMFLFIGAPELDMWPKCAFATDCNTNKLSSSNCKSPLLIRRSCRSPMTISDDGDLFFPY